MALVVLAALGLGLFVFAHWPDMRSSYRTRKGERRE